MAVFVLPFWLLWWLVLAELWLAAECVLSSCSPGSWCPHLATGGAGSADVTLTRLKLGLCMSDVKGKR